MNYLKDLLESYSRLKKRKLKLLEQASNQISGDSPEQRVAYIISQVKGKNYTEKNPLVLSLGDKQFQCFISASRKQVTVKYGARNYNVEYNPKPLYPHLVTGEDEGAEPETPEQGQEQQTEQPQDQQFDPSQVTQAIMDIAPGAGVMQSELAINNPAVAQEIIQVFQEIVPDVQSAWTNLPKDIKLKYKNNIANFTVRIYGNRPGSFESQVSKAFVVVKDANGNLVTIKASGDQYTSLQVSKSFQKVVKILGKDSLDDNDKNILNNLVGVTKDGEVIILDVGGNEGMIFNDNSGHLKNILQSIESKFKYKTNIINPNVLTNTRQDNALQSTFFEEIPSILALGSTCKQGMDIPNDDSCRKLFQLLMQKYSDKSSQLLKILTPFSMLERTNQDFAMKISQGDLTGMFLREVLKNGTQRMYQTIIRVAKHAMVARKPERSIPKGLDTKRGRRLDATEVWSTREQLESALLNSGIPMEDIQSYGFIKEMSIEDAYNYQKDLRNVDSRYKPGQKVYTLDISYKHYLSLKEGAKAGEGTSNSRQEFFKGLDLETGSENDRIASLKFRQAMSKNLFDGEDLSPNSSLAQELSRYNDGLTEIYQRVQGLAVNAKVLSPNSKKLIKAKPFEELAKNTIDELLKNSAYSEIYGDIDIEEPEYTGDPGIDSKLKARYGKRLKERNTKIDRDRKELLNYLNETVYKKESESNSEYAAAIEDRAKHALSMFLRNKALQRDLNSEDEGLRTTARKYQAAKMFLAGGANDDTLICDYRELYGKKNFIFRQNQAFAMVKDWLNGSEDYEMSFQGNSFTLAKKGSKSYYIKSNDFRLDDNPFSGEESSNSSLYFGTELMESMDGRKKIKGFVGDSVELTDDTKSMLFEFLEHQKDILTKIFKSISKDV